MFRTFEAEAFVIPTGSMAPTLMGQHKDLLCPECGYRYRAGASSEAEDVARQRGRPAQAREVVDVTCPLCRYIASVDPNTAEGRQHPTYGGDRILVNKCSYEFGEPARWDVLVFKYPGEAQTNYIKRLVGLPRETIRIWHGDIYVKPDGSDAFGLERREPKKLRAMAQIVYDNDYVVDAMTDRGWPVRWQPWPAAGTEAKGRGPPPTAAAPYQIDGTAADVQWLRYQHFVPTIGDWQLLKERSRLPADYRPMPSLITDFYAYDTSVQRGDPLEQPPMLGLHWVGDLLLECQLDVTTATGTVLLELIEGGRRFRCELDCQTGKARLSIDGLNDFAPTGQTSVRGAGSHQVALANIDDQLTLWVDGSSVTFDGPTAYPPLHNDYPRSDDQDPGDLAPAGIGSRSAGLRVSHIRLLRDIYYIAATPGGPVSDYPQETARISRMKYQQLAQFWSTPALWKPAGQASLFDERREVLFPLAAEQFFVLGDNSPVSQDARLWDGERYVSQDLLVGKALFIFWPHSFNRVPGTSIPFPFFPNFARMRFIR